MPGSSHTDKRNHQWIQSIPIILDQLRHAYLSIFDPAYRAMSIKSHLEMQISVWSEKGVNKESVEWEKAVQWRGSYGHIAK